MDATLHEEHAILQDRHWWFRGRRRIVSAVLDRHLERDPERLILDAGCGAGGMLDTLSAHGRVRDIEPDPGAVRWCHEHFPTHRVDVGSIPEALPTSAELDLITAFDVIEHVEDDTAALAAFATALRPGGHLLITVPALPWLWSAHDERNQHFRRYTASTLDAVTLAAGLTIVHRTYYNTALLPLAAGRRMFERVRPSEPESDLFLPSRPMNGALAAIFGAERHIVSRRRLPIGVSLLVLARAD